MERSHDARRHVTPIMAIELVIMTLLQRWVAIRVQQEQRSRCTILRWHWHYRAAQKCPQRRLQPEMDDATSLAPPTAAG